MGATRHVFALSVVLCGTALAQDDEIERWLHRLESPSLVDRIEAVRRLETLGDSAGERRRIVEALGAVVRDRRDEHHGVRHAAEESLGRISDTLQREYLASERGHPDRAAAYAETLRLVARTLKPAAADDYAPSRNAAFHAFANSVGVTPADGEFSDAEYFARLLTREKDGRYDLGVGSEVIRLIGFYRKRLDDGPTDEARGRALTGLRDLAGVLAAQARAKDDEVRERAVERLGDILRALEPALKSRDRETREKALAILDSIDNTIVPLLRHEDDGTRRYAEIALGNVRHGRDLAAGRHRPSALALLAKGMRSGLATLHEALESARSEVSRGSPFDRARAVAKHALLGTPLLLVPGGPIVYGAWLGTLIHAAMTGHVAGAEPAASPGMTSKFDAVDKAIEGR